MRPIAVIVCLVVSMAMPALSPAQAGESRPPDVIFLPTPDDVVDAMLKLANVRSRDVVYDLGSGDGRIVIRAAKKYGARGVGIDIDPLRVADANRNASAAGVTKAVRFVLGDIFDSSIPITDASVVTLYLLPSLNVKLMPRLRAELKPGSRIVSNSFDMGDAWRPDKAVSVGTHYVYLWTVR
jgi:SAM-dependent methyltransferase